jgi:hypothetical protein
MGPTIKRVVAAAGVVTAVKVIRKRRKHQRHALVRFAPAGLIVGGVAGALVYFAKVGRAPWSGESVPEGDTGSTYLSDSTGSETHPAEVGI